MGHVEELRPQIVELQSGGVTIQRSWGKGGGLLPGKGAMVNSAKCEHSACSYELVRVRVLVENNFGASGVLLRLIYHNLGCWFNRTSKRACGWSAYCWSDAGLSGSTQSFKCDRCF